MMLQELAEHLYLYIISAEMVFLRFFKVNPFQMMNNMSMLDLDMYLKRIQYEEEQERNRTKKKDIMQCLKHVCDYLNVIFHKK